MGRIRLSDRALVAALATLWALCFALSIRSCLRLDPAPALYVSLPHGTPAYPRMVGRVEWMETEPTDVRVGDRLTRVGDADLRGVGPLGVFARLAAALRTDRTVVFQIERAGAPHTAAVPVDTVARRWPALPVSFAFAFFAVFLRLRAPSSPMARAFFASMMCTAFALACSFAGEPPLVYASAAVFLVSVSLWGPLAVRAAQSMFTPPAWTGRFARWAPWTFAVLGPINLAADYGGPLPGDVAVLLRDLAMVAILATVLVLGQRAFARVDAQRRRQLKWVVLGLGWAAIPKLVAGFASAIDPRLEWLWTLGLVPAVVCPLCLLIGVARANLFDIDRLISASTAYTITVVIIAAAGLVLVPRLAAFAGDAVPVAPWVSQALLSLALASLIVPAARRLSPRIDRIFFPARFELARGIDRLLDEVTRCEAPDALVIHVGEELAALLDPQGCAIYARTGTGYAPVFVRGQTSFPDLDADGPLVAQLAREHRPLEVAEWMRSHPAMAIAERERETLDLLAGAVVVPVHREARLDLIVVLGPKRSGDVYTRTDLVLLAAVRDRMSTALRRLDSGRVRAIGEETARMVHDLKSPLSIAKGYTQLLSRARTPEEEQRIGHLVLQQFDRMRRMTADVMSFTRGDSDLLVSKVNLNEFLEDLRQQLGPDLRRHGVALVVEAEFDGAAYFDESQILRAVSNLARNAMEAMPNGGVFRIVSRLSNGRIMLECADDGPGLPPEMQGRLFTAFATAGKAGGTGLGLGSVKRVVEAHGGSITVRSRAQHGTVFTIELPLRP